MVKPGVAQPPAQKFAEGEQDDLIKSVVSSSVAATSFVPFAPVAKEAPAQQQVVTNGVDKVERPGKKGVAGEKENEKFGDPDEEAQLIADAKQLFRTLSEGKLAGGPGTAGSLLRADSSSDKDTIDEDDPVENPTFKHIVSSPFVHPEGVQADKEEWEREQARLMLRDAATNGATIVTSADASGVRVSGDIQEHGLILVEKPDATNSADSGASSDTVEEERETQPLLQNVVNASFVHPEGVQAQTEDWEHGETATSVARDVILDSVVRAASSSSSSAHVGGAMPPVGGAGGSSSDDGVQSVLSVEAIGRAEAVVGAVGGAGSGGRFFFLPEGEKFPREEREKEKEWLQSVISQDIAAAEWEVRNGGAGIAVPDVPAAIAVPDVIPAAQERSPTSSRSTKKVMRIMSPDVDDVRVFTGFTPSKSASLAEKAKEHAQKRRSSLKGILSERGAPKNFGLRIEEEERLDVFTWCK